MERAAKLYLNNISSVTCKKSKRFGLERTVAKDCMDKRKIVGIVCSQSSRYSDLNFCEMLMNPTLILLISYVHTRDFTRLNDNYSRSLQLWDSFALIVIPAAEIACSCTSRVQQQHKVAVYVGFAPQIA